MSAAIHHGDCLEVLRGMADASVDAVVTDPPYGLSFMGKKWDYDVPSEDIWRECLRVLKPGGHLLAFAGTRTQHRMAVRIEDAGFEIRDMIAWVYGSGFPKSLDVSKAIDKAAAVEREVVGLNQHAAKRTGHGKEGVLNSRGAGLGGIESAQITAHATEAARQWQGFGTALKPSLEPVTLARKPLIGTVAENVLAHGTGAINVDGCRVEGEGGKKWGTPRGGIWTTNSEAKAKLVDSVAGRWPANLIHDGSDEVVGLFPQTKAGVAIRSRSGGKTCHSNQEKPPMEDMGYGDSGSAARFFKCCEAEESEVDPLVHFLRAVATPHYSDSNLESLLATYRAQAQMLLSANDRFFYCAKASKADRDEGLDGFNKRVVNVTEGHGRGAINTSKGGDGLRENRPRANTHPTVKPTALMRYLCRLVTPPRGIVLDPFMGSGSTGKAATLEGFQFIGIEREAEYVAIAKARIAKAEAERGEMLPLEGVAA